jgi:hypothetical protein
MTEDERRKINECTARMLQEPDSPDDDPHKTAHKAFLRAHLELVNGKPVPKAAWPSGPGPDRGQGEEKG